MQFEAVQIEEVQTEEIFLLLFAFGNFNIHV